MSKKIKERYNSVGHRLGEHSLSIAKDRQRKGLRLDSLDYLALGLQPPKDRKVVMCTDAIPHTDEPISVNTIIDIATNHARQDKQNGKTIHESYPDKLAINGGSKILPTGGEGFTFRKKIEGLRDLTDVVYAEAYRQAKDRYGKVKLDIVEFQKSDEYKSAISSFNNRHSKDKK